MTLRADAMSHFRDAACAALGNENCFPGVQPGRPGAVAGGAFALPSIVYYAVGQDTLETLAGPAQTGTAIRYEARDRSYKGAVALSAAARVVRDDAKQTSAFADKTGALRASIRANRRAQKVHTSTGLKKVPGAAAQVRAGGKGTARKSFTKLGRDLAAGKASKLTRRLIAEDT